MKNNILAKFAAFAALLGVAATAHAAGITIGANDLVLGFQDASNSIQIDLTNTLSATTVQNGATVDLGSFNINTALSSPGNGGTTGAAGYGSTWASTAGISWTVFGKDTNNFYAAMGQSAPSSTLGSGPATANSTLAVGANTASAQSSVSTMYSTMVTEPNSVQIRNGLAAGNPILGAKYTNASTASVNSIDKAGVGSGVAFGTFQNPSLLNTTVTTTTTGTTGLLAGKVYSAVDLYQFSGTGPTFTSNFLGTLALTNTGELFFTAAQAAAIPEPSTYAALLGVVTLGVVAIRRRRQAALEIA
jgi:hypothetical protein